MTVLETANSRIAGLEAEVKLLSDLVQEVVAIGQQEHAMRLELESELAAVRALGTPVVAGEPYAYAVYFPDQPCEELVHDLDDLTEDLTNREHVITKLYAQPPAAQDAEPDMFWDADNIEIFAYDIEEIVSEYDPGQIVSIECAQRLPSFRVLVTPGEDGNSYEYLDAAIAAQGEKT